MRIWGDRPPTGMLYTPDDWLKEDQSNDNETSNDEKTSAKENGRLLKFKFNEFIQFMKQLDLSKREFKIFEQLIEKYYYSADSLKHTLEGAKFYFIEGYKCMDPKNNDYTEANKFFLEGIGNLITLLRAINKTKDTFIRSIKNPDKKKQLTQKIDELLFVKNTDISRRTGGSRRKTRVKRNTHRRHQNGRKSRKA